MRLLQRFGVDDALIGDLVEQRQAGRSRVWLWWQLLVAVLAVVARDIAMQPIRFAIGLLLAGLLRYVTIGAWGAYEPWIDMTIARLFLDAVPLNRPPLLVAVACVNAILLAPVWGRDWLRRRSRVSRGHPRLSGSCRGAPCARRRTPARSYDQLGRGSLAASGAARDVRNNHRRLCRERRDGRYDRPAQPRFHRLIAPFA